MNLTTVAQLAQTYYGLVCVVEKLAGEYDENFHLITTDGTRFIMKIMRADCDAELVAMQCAALEFLAKHDLSVQTPQVQLTLAGETFIKVETGEAEPRIVWMLTYLNGIPWAKYKASDENLLFALGQEAGILANIMRDFAHPATHRVYKWDLAQAHWIQNYTHYIEDSASRDLVQQIVNTFITDTLPTLTTTRKSIIHGDLNDHNIIVHPVDQTLGIIDFGDMVYTHTICDVAVACAYAIFAKADVLASLCQVVAGYHQALALSEEELALLYSLICMRLCVSVTNSAYRQTQGENDPYITISEAQAWIALDKLTALHPRLVYYALREACGYPAISQRQHVITWLQKNQAHFASVIPFDCRTTPTIVLDLSVGSLLLGANPANAQTPRLTKIIQREMDVHNVQYSVGRYNEARLLYTSNNFSEGQHPAQPHRTIHLGLDLWMQENTPVFAPLAGKVHCVHNNAQAKDYGPVVILAHETTEGVPFYTLYGHLSQATLDHIVIGKSIDAGERIGWLGAPPTNGDWPPHLHFQIILDLLELDYDFPGVAFASQRELWLNLSPDPNLIVGIPADYFPRPAPTKAESLAKRQALLGNNVRLSYHNPLKMVQGWLQYLYDETGQAYLDVYNNVPHVGHSHPQVVTAIQRQVALLNTNTRYLHDNILEYAERLTNLMPDPLTVCFFVNSGSEANELALRLARTYTQKQALIVLDEAYHGHTNTLIDISPYKFNKPGGSGQKAWVHIAPMPDDYRGQYKRGDTEAGAKYALEVKSLIDDIQAQGQDLGGFIAETLPSVGGQIVPPPNYLRDVYGYVRQAGGVCIADEVQVGFGRLGETFWGFEMQGVMPDIVVLGKSIGGGHPLAAVVTTPAIASAFDNGLEFFSTFGGNPVSCAAGLAVLDVIEAENLQAHAQAVGTALLEALHELQQTYPVIGDVRGSGLFLGIELVLDPHELTPATDYTRYVVNELRSQHILVGTEGKYNNVIKIRPPLAFQLTDAQFFTQTLQQILANHPPR